MLELADHGQAFWVSVWVGDIVDHQIVLVEIPADALPEIIRRYTQSTHIQAGFF